MDVSSLFNGFSYGIHNRIDVEQRCILDEQGIEMSGRHASRYFGSLYQDYVVITGGVFSYLPGCIVILDYIILVRKIFEMEQA